MDVKDMVESENCGINVDPNFKPKSFLKRFNCWEHLMKSFFKGEVGEASKISGKLIFK